MQVPEFLGQLLILKQWDAESEREHVKLLVVIYNYLISMVLPIFPQVENSFIGFSDYKIIKI